MKPTKVEMEVCDSILIGSLLTRHNLNGHKYQEITPYDCSQPK